MARISPALGRAEQEQVRQVNLMMMMTQLSPPWVSNVEHMGQLPHPEVLEYLSS